MVSIKQLAADLLTSLSKDAQALTDPTSSEFKDFMTRWSDMDKKSPSAIVIAACEDDVVKIVEFAIQHDIPFVPKSGGNTVWSSIGPEGWVIDLSQLNSISLDTINHTATIQAGVTTKPLNETVSKAGFCIQTPSSYAVGFIPFMLGGGSSNFNGLYGMAVDSLVSARVVTATRGLVTASQSENSDLFWALRGAGQFFGLVTEVTMKIYPLESTIITWTCIFLPQQISEVSKAVEEVINGDDNAKSPGVAAVMAPPGQTKPMIMINIIHARPELEAEKIMAPLLALKPINQIKKKIALENLTDATQTLCSPGGQKYIASCGMQKFQSKNLEQIFESWSKLVDKFPGAAGSFFLFNWFSTEAMKNLPETAWGHRDCGVWSMLFINASDEPSGRAAVKSAEEFVAICQADQKDYEKAIFPNHYRGDNIQYRYRGKGRLEKLRELKKMWDPKGVFTDQLL